MDRKTISAWAAYDWASTAVNAIVFTFVFSVYFVKSVYGDEVAGSAAWSYAQGWAGVVIAVCSPILGAAIDRYGPHKPVLKFLTVAGAALTAGLYFVEPQASSVVMALVLGAVLTIIFEFIQNIYNSTLGLVAKPADMGRVSGIGWGFGYFGSIVCLVIVLLLFIGLGNKGGLLGITKDGAQHVRMAMVFTGLWFAVFAIPYFAYCPDAPRESITFRQSVIAAIGDCKAMVREARAYPEILKFLAASAVYRDALATLFAVGGLYAAGTLHMGFSEVMIFAIAMNVASGVGALAFSFLDHRIGAKVTVMVSLVGLVLFGTGVLLTSDKTMFIALACAMGLFIGPVQASSRTMLAQMAPPEKLGSFFGIYSMTGKAVSFVGPFAFAALTSAFDSQRAGIASILAFWIIGLMMVYFVKPNTRSA
ncbi:MAG: MFS transporter [Alphaproteobacteria bacterium]|nr:MFS transporter [Alphaproteobacteria bacterium]